MATKYFLVAASRDHVLKGIKGGFVQAGHGRKDYVSKFSKGDWVVYYSAKDRFENGKPLQRFTAIGQIVDDVPFQSTHNPDKESHEAEIRPLIEKLGFIRNKWRWGFYLMSGFREISKDDFEIISNAMKLT